MHRTLFVLQTCIRLLTDMQRQTETDRQTDICFMCWIWACLDSNLQFHSGTAFLDNLLFTSLHPPISLSLSLSPSQDPERAVLKYFIAEIRDCCVHQYRITALSQEPEVTVEVRGYSSN